MVLKEKRENTIRREIEFMFGRAIASSRDCLQLSEEIFSVTRSRLNSNTLRRFFKLVKTNYSASGSTLQILCNYCGFSSLDDLDNHKITTIEGDESVTREQTVLLNFLVNIFKDTPVPGTRSETFGSIVKQTIIFLTQNPDLVDRFQSMVAKTKNGQDYYFGFYVQIDRLNSFFGNGLRFFLKERLDREAQIFGHSLLVFRYWLTENQDGMEKHHQQLQAIGYDPSLSYCSSGRYFASLVYYADATGDSFTATISIINAYRASLESENVELQVRFDMVVAEALIFTTNFDEGLYYVDAAIKKLSVIEKPEESILQNLYLLQALALVKIGDYSLARSTYNLIRPTAFDPLSKKILTLLYRVLHQQIKKDIKKVDNQEEVLIGDTGFTRLRSVFDYRGEKAKGSSTG